MEEDDGLDARIARNLAEKERFFAEFIKNSKRQASTDSEEEVTEAQSRRNDENKPPRKKRRRSTGGAVYWRPKQVYLGFQRNYNTRSRARRMSSGSDCKSSDDKENDKEGNGPKLTVMFPWATPMQREIDLMKLDVFTEEEDQEEHDENSWLDDCAPKRRVLHRVARSAYDPDSIPSPDDITEKQLQNVAHRSSDKIHSKASGVSCHQCRQKTLDTKTVCRSGECIGVRGQFCGPCLRGRYGESAVEALKDPEWACPPCRGLCNCSICRTRSGKRPTGILAPAVQEEGFSSVMHYLESGGTEENDSS